jgi:hypothetical protein
LIPAEIRLNAPIGCAGADQRGFSWPKFGRVFVAFANLCRSAIDAVAAVYPVDDLLVRTA